jgi:hypothetical protein
LFAFFGNVQPRDVKTLLEEGVTVAPDLLNGSNVENQADKSIKVFERDHSDVNFQQSIDGK